MDGLMKKETGWPSDTNVSHACVTTLQRYSGVGGTEDGM